MIKRTIHIGTSSYLHIESRQLKIVCPTSKAVKGTVPVEDIGVLILDHPQITITQSVLKKLIDHNAVLINCNDQHMPQAMFLNLEGHHTMSERSSHQLSASEPLKKQLWQQTIEAKIKNQLAVLRIYKKSYKRLDVLKDRVQSGDSTNVEGQAARYYWANLFTDFNRDRYGDPPNHLLNYGYILLRSLTARALVSSGLLPICGIHHRNKYNHFCLADDIMEPYRPYVDQMVYNIWERDQDMFLSKESKVTLLSIPTIEVRIKGRKSSLLQALTTTTSSLNDCFEGVRRKLIFPEMNINQ